MQLAGPGRPGAGPRGRRGSVQNQHEPRHQPFGGGPPPSRGSMGGGAGRPDSVESTQAQVEEFLDLPLLETLNRINAQVGGLQKQLAKVDDEVTAAMHPEREQEDTHKTFLTDIDSEEKSRQRSSLARHTSDSPKNVKSVEEAEFPGYVGKPADLPNNVSVMEVLKRLSDRMQITKSKDSSAWEVGLMDPHTLDIMKDLFWWFFCEKFEGQRYEEEQEKMFSRMASNFICLLTAVPHNQKDRFFDRYHDVLSQATYAAFRVAFPNSESRMGGDFRSELSRLFAYWTTGADIGPSEYILKNGREVKRNLNSGGVLEVIQDMLKEQNEMEQMAMDKKKKPSRTTSDSKGRSFDGMPKSAMKTPRRTPATPSAKNLSTTPGARSALATGMHGSSLLGPDSAAESRTAWRKNNNNFTASTVGAPMGGHSKPNSVQLPAVPPLRLPPKPDTELRTPRVIWTARTGEGAYSTARSGAATERVSGRTVSAPHPKRIGGASTAREHTSASPGSNASGARRPDEAAEGGANKRPFRRGRMLGARRPDEAAEGGANKRPFRRGRMFDREGKRVFDLHSMSPFMAYYMATQVSVVVTQKHMWKKISCDEAVRAWDVPRPKLRAAAKKNKGLDDDEEDEDQGRYPKSPREIGEAAVKRNARIVREYQKKAGLRSVAVTMQRRVLSKQNKETRGELQSIIQSQEMSNAFSNMLVSSGGGVTFDTVWKKQKTDIFAAVQKADGAPAGAK